MTAIFAITGLVCLLTLAGIELVVAAVSPDDLTQMGLQE
jgi:hypothetical protein